jgi:hypothetical protein
MTEVVRSPGANLLSSSSAHTLLRAEGFNLKWSGFGSLWSSVLRVLFADDCRHLFDCSNCHSFCHWRRVESGFSNDLGISKTSLKHHRQEDLSWNGTAHSSGPVVNLRSEILRQLSHENLVRHH